MCFFCFIHNCGFEPENWIMSLKRALNSPRCRYFWFDKKEMKSSVDLFFFLCLRSSGLHVGRSEVVYDFFIFTLEELEKLEARYVYRFKVLPNLFLYSVYVFVFILFSFLPSCSSLKNAFQAVRKNRSLSCSSSPLPCPTWTICSRLRKTSTVSSVQFRFVLSP